MAAKFGVFPRNKFTNATIRLDKGVKFSVHKSLMAKESDFFKTLFKFHNLTEYTVSGVDGRIFGKLLDWIYEHRIRLTTRDAFRLRELADYLLCPAVLDFTSETIKSRAQYDNIFRLKSLCSKFKTDDLHDWCMEYIEANIQEISKSREFLTLPLESLKATLYHYRLRSSPRVCEIWKAVGKWVLFDHRNRSMALMQLMVLARVDELGSNFQENVYPVLEKCKFGRKELIHFLKVLFMTWESSSLDLEDELGEGSSSETEIEC